MKISGRLFMQGINRKSLLGLFDLNRNFPSLWHRSGQDRFSSVDGLRALSLLYIVGLHIVWYTGYVLPSDQFLEIMSRPELSWIQGGAFGVDIFFTISGFLIGYLLFTEIKKTGGISLRQFYMRRAFRIFPAYFFVLAVMALIFPDNVENVGHNIIYLNNFLPYDEQFMIWSWSLAIEEQFYTAFPLLLLVIFYFRPFVFMVLIALMIFAFFVRYHAVSVESLILPSILHPAYYPVEFGRFWDLLYDKPHLRYGGILIGAIVAYMLVYTRSVNWLSEHTWARRSMLFISIMGVILYLVPKTGGNHEQDMSPGYAAVLASYRYIFNLFIAGIILYTLTSSGKMSWIAKLLSARILYPIAQLSYSAYLIHPIIIMLSLDVFYNNGAPGRLEMGAIFIGIFAVVFLCSTMIFIIIEKPFINIRYFFSPPEAGLRKVRGDSVMNAENT